MKHDFGATPLGARPYVVGPAPSVLTKAQFCDGRHKFGAREAAMSAFAKSWRHE
jgi:hypothetical protein